MSLYKVPVILVIATLVLSFAACSSGPNGQEIPLGNGTLYYLPPVTQIEAERFVAYAKDNGLGENETVVQLGKESGAYEVRMRAK
jgi:hypothetical protein